MSRANCELVRYCRLGWQRLCFGLHGGTEASSRHNSHQLDLWMKRKFQPFEYVTVVTCRIAFLHLWFSGRNWDMKRKSSMVCTPAESRPLRHTYTWQATAPGELAVIKPGPFAEAWTRTVLSTHLHLNLNLKHFFKGL